jgi:two-component system, NarL family, sensor kinase
MQESVQIVTIVLIGTLLFLILVAFVIVSLFFYQRSQYKHHKEVTGLKNAYEQELLKANLEVKEQTLSTVAQELHDNIGQILSLVKLNLHTVTVHSEGPASLKLKNATELVSKAITDLRNLSKTLNTDYLMEQDLQESIRQAMDQLQKTGTIHATFEVSGSEKPLTPQKRLIAFRIFQEALNNAIKHANASRVEALLKYDEQAIVWTLKDNGKGFHFSGIRKKLNGTGIKNMEHRADLIGSQFKINTSPDSGTLIQLHIPL